MEKKMDLRIVKTYTALTAALEGLLLEKPLQEITVSEICEKAMIRRATFYKHFGDKNELFAFILKEMQADIRAKQDEARASAQDTKNDFYRDIVIMLEYIETKETLFCALNNYCSIGALSDLVSNSLAQAIKEHLMRNEISCDTQAASLTFTCQMLSGALIHGISWWLNHKEFYTKYEVAKQFYAFFIDVIEK